MKRFSLGGPVVALGLAGMVCAATNPAPAMAQDYAYIGANLFGENIQGGGGHDDAVGDFASEANLDTGEWCYYLEIDGFSDATAATIHEGGKSDTGPVVLTLTLPPDPSDEVCFTADMAVLRAIAEDAEDYYLTVTSRAHPAGAIRGQLR